MLSPSFSFTLLFCAATKYVFSHRMCVNWHPDVFYLLSGSTLKIGWWIFQERFIVSIVQMERGNIQEDMDRERETCLLCEKESERERKWMGHNIPFLREVSPLNYSNFTTADSAHISLQLLCESRVLLLGIAAYKTGNV